jgi:hypothetical protein
MPRNHNPSEFDPILPTFRPWKRLAIIWGVLVVVGLLFLTLTWNTFFKYVPPGKHLVVSSKNGAPQDQGEVLAKEGQKGVLREVKGEGWHFVMPILYTTELEDNTIIPPGKVGIVTALGGRTPPDGRMLAEEGQRGIQRNVLPPGAYRVNKHGYEVELVDATEIKPGFVGVMRRLLGTPGKGLFAREDTDEQGYLPKVLQPGFYYINTKEFEVIKAEIGIVQTSFRAPAARDDKDTAITFTAKGGFSISIDCTVEWEVLAAHMPALVAEYGTWHEVEKKVIDVQAHAIGRDKGIDYGVQDFLEGSKREKFQEDFTQELTKVCKEKNVTVHSAFIRRIVIPEDYLKPIRDKQIALETQITTKAKELTAETENQVEREQRMIQQEMAKVEAETKKITGSVDQQVKNLVVLTEAEIERMKADYGKKIAALDAERTKLEGQAQAEATKLKETAKSSINQMKMEVFQNDAAAFLRYTLAEQLNPNMVLRLFHSGTGTFWTNMDNKNLNLMVPAQVAPAPPRDKAKNDGDK